MKKLIGLCASLIFSLLITSCSKDLAPGIYDTSDVGKVKKVASGVIISKRAVTFQSKKDANLKAPGTEFVDGDRGYVYVIKLKSGGIVSIAQAEDLHLKVKQSVLVVYGKNSRILPDDGSND